ncbi:hypothetical protein TWF102_000808 [Orbilia oligospora]|uniref:Uncharacterized protein n=1 Tax=Orbilia oligospora TaxID=2813651 RepID=A0A7C8JAN9_ORBOL|nr:hypothetical protein TWF102_000808 [Orbilia oligospora]
MQLQPLLLQHLRRHPHAQQLPISISGIDNTILRLYIFVVREFIPSLTICVTLRRCKAAIDASWNGNLKLYTSFTVLRLCASSDISQVASSPPDGDGNNNIIEQRECLQTETFDPTEIINLPLQGAVEQQ